MQQYTYSIIIPHKNIPDLLQRCLDSIPIRDDVQVIVVDDNSDPDIVEFGLFPGLNRPNTEVYFDKTGRGAGRARNVGLEHAKGDWLLFADADDYFNYCLNDVLNEYLNCDSDIIFFNACSLDCDMYTNSDRSLLTNRINEIYFKNKTLGEFLCRFHQGVPWSKIIKKGLVFENRFCFDETPIVNDTTFAYLIGHKASSISVDRRAIYCVTMRNSSITYTMSTEKYLAIIEVFSRKYKFLKDNGVDFYEHAIPVNMKKLLTAGNHDAYSRGVSIMKKYGLDESFLDKKYFKLPQKSQFIDTLFYQELEEAYNTKGVTYKLIKTVLDILRFIRHIQHQK